MKTTFALLFSVLILSIPAVFSTFTFEVARIKIAVFELIMPWIFFIWLYLNVKRKFASLISLPRPVLVSWAAFFLCGVFLYLRNEFKVICFENIILSTLLFTLLLAVLEGDMSRWKVHKLIFLSSIFVFSYGSLQIFGFNPLKYGGELLEKGRIFSSMANPNDLALYCSLIFFLGLYYVIEKKNKYLLPLIIWALVILAFSKSSSGILAVLLSGMLLSLSFKKSVRILLFFLFLVILVSVLTSTVCLKSDSAFYRSYIWEDTFRMIEQKPLLGWGLGSFAYVYPAFRNPKLFLLLKDHQIEFLHPENYYLNLAAEGGIVYLLLFIAMNVILFYYLLKYRRSRICFYYFAILGGMLFQNIFSETFHSFAVYFLYILIFGLTLVEVRNREPNKQISNLAFSRQAYSTFFLLCAVLNLILMFFSLRMFISGIYLKKAVYDSQLRSLVKAESFYQKSIKFNYFNPLSHYLMANVYLEKGSDEDLYNALKSYSDVESMAGNYLQVYAFKGLTYHKLNDKERADFYFQKAFLNDPYLYYQFKHYLEVQD